jgi:hypothetical protein
MPFDWYGTLKLISSFSIKIYYEVEILGEKSWLTKPAMAFCGSWQA